MARHPRHTERTAARDARALCSRHHQLRSGPSPWPTTNISNTFASSSSGNTSHPPVHLALPTSRRSKAAIGNAWHTAGALSCVSTPPTQNSFPPPTNLPHLRLLPWLDSFEPQDANTRSHMHSESTRKIRPRNTMPSEDGIRLSETRSARVKLGVPYYIEEPPPEFPRGNSAKRPALPALTLCSCRRAVLRHLPLPSRIACSYCASGHHADSHRRLRRIHTRVEAPGLIRRRSRERWCSVAHGRAAPAYFLQLSLTTPVPPIGGNAPRGPSPFDPQT